MKDHHDTISASTFWDRLGDVTAGMLSIDSDKAIPMTPYLDREGGAIWFITSRDASVAKATMSGTREAQFIVACKDAGLFATINGHARQTMDREKLDEFWSVHADAWFEQGKDDPDLTMIVMRLSDAEAWATDGAAKYLFDVAKSQITGDVPDGGEHGELSF